MKPIDLVPGYVEKPIDLETIRCPYNVPRGFIASTRPCNKTAKLEARIELSRDLTTYRYKCPSGHITRVRVKR